MDNLPNIEFFGKILNYKNITRSKTGYNEIERRRSVLDKYQDMRLYCLENGGEYAQKVKDERDRRYNGEWALRFPFEVKEYPAFIVLNRELQFLIIN